MRKEAVRPKNYDWLDAIRDHVRCVENTRRLVHEIKGLDHLNGETVEICPPIDLDENAGIPTG